MNDSIKRKKNLGMAIAVIFTAVFAIITGACPHESGRKIYLQNLSGTISILPDGDEINFGSTLEAVYSGKEAVSFQWYRNGEAIDGATQNTYTADAAGVYTVTVSFPGHRINISDPVTVKEEEEPGILDLPGEISILPDGEIDFGSNLEAVYSGKESVNYQWYRDGEAIDGATENTYTADTAGVYTVTVSLAGYQSKTSTPVTVKEEEDPGILDLSGTISITPEGDEIACGSMLEAVYEGTEDVNYQWYKDGEAIGGATENTYTADAAGVYTVTVSLEGYRSKTSAPVTVKEEEEPGILDLSGTISITPSGNDIALGTLLTAVYTGGESISYQWSRDGEAIGGATENTYTAVTEGDYTVTVSLAGYESKTSAPVTVKEEEPGILNLSGTISITPSGNNIALGTLLTAVYTGSESVSYQWSKDGDAIGGAAQNTYTANATGAYTVTVSLAGYESKASAPVTVIGSLLPQFEYPVLDESIPQTPGKMFFQFNNKTGGAYSDSQIYIVVLGLKKGSPNFHYVNKDGVMIEGSQSMNTLTVSGRSVADVSFTLADTNHVYMPDISSGRMFFSYQKPVYITFHAGGGYAGPDINNATDPNINTYFEFIEFTIDNGEYWGNTTRVDSFCFPVVTRLFGNGGNPSVYDKSSGEIGTREYLFTAFDNEVPSEFKSLKSTMRILAPCKGSFNSGQPNGTYFDAYINMIWEKYKTTDLVFQNSEGGAFTGRVDTDNILKLSSNFGSWTNMQIRKPSTQDALEGKGTLDDHFRGGTSNPNPYEAADLAAQAQLCAAINRGVAHDGSLWGKKEEYYNNAPANFYSKFWHDHSFEGQAYGFCYDDVNDQATLLSYSKPTALVVDLKW